MTIRKNKLQNIIEKIVLDEMMAVGIGGVATGQIAGVPALPIGSKLVIPKDIKQPAGRKKRRLTTEANTVTGMQLSSYGLNDIEQMDFLNSDVTLDTELDTETDTGKTDSPKKNTRDHKIPKTKNLKMNPFQKLMWAGDSPVPNVLKVKYVIVESYRKNNLQTQKNHATVNCDKTLNPIVKDAVTDFLNFVQNKLKLDSFPEIYLMSERQTGMTTGAYLPSKKIIFALIKNRLMIDVFRTIAHELTHCKQDERKELDNLPLRKDEYDMSDINTPYENEAYANAGNYVKEWSRIMKIVDRDRLYEMQM